ncbi:hypothetical protein [Brucella sp. JSBI001]|uniref:Uncharacterized protein n=1 Tax=Brucella anthropi TaxID=529 RepID=A0A8I0T7F5_BRUAN|nr:MULTISPECIES: hypothetical protein [Brucella]MBE0559977.1 hypothetical protein [Brucella anthropi]QTN05618.1 hypothetical protein GTN27_20895 [Ochrobactrum sp. EEELCW01]UZD71624.1 hypothetical protein LJ361_09735 [Brucella sp. JSBI001]
MSNFLFRGAIAVFGLGALYLGSSQNARSDDWGCKVILCLSNPGGATQYAQCRPPVQKLWRWLARGKSFPTCSSAGFESSRPRYEPYYCNDGYRLTVSYADRRRVVSCVSTSAQAVNSILCKHRSEQLRNDDGLFVDAKWHYEKGYRQCMGHKTARPLVREKPNYIDVTIDGVGKQRVWF